MDWFLYNMDLRYERVKWTLGTKELKIICSYYVKQNYDRDLRHESVNGQTYLKLSCSWKVQVYFGMCDFLVYTRR